MNKPTCVIEGCEKPRNYAQGWCPMHYQRWKAHGSLDKPQKPAKATPKPCSVDGCDGPQSAKGLCGKHYRADYHQQHKVRAYAQQVARRAADRPAYLAEQMAYYFANREVALESARQRRAANPAQQREYRRRWREANPARRRELEMRRQALKRGGKVTKTDYAAIITEFGMVCHICGDGIPSMSDLHFDHVIPLAKGGSHTHENIKPSHAICNMQKHDKLLA